MSRADGAVVMPLMPRRSEDMALSAATTPRSLDEARLSRDNFVVLQGSQQGQIYLACQAVLVVCWEPVLGLLLRDLDAIPSPRRTAQACIRYEGLPSALLQIDTAPQRQEMSGLWIHEHFTLLGLDRPTRGILKGRLGRIPLSERIRYATLNRAQHGAQLIRGRLLG